MTFNLDTYKNLLGYKESSGSYQTNTGNGAYGKYQFLPSTIRGIANLLNEMPPTITDFLNSPQLQDRYLKALVEDSLSYIKNNNLKVFEGAEREGQGNKIKSKINIYGMVAGIHLGGAGNFRDYLTKGIDKSDNTNRSTGGTYISDYVTFFSNKIDVKKKSTPDNSNNIPDTVKEKLTIVLEQSIQQNEILQKILNDLKDKINE